MPRGVLAARLTAKQEHWRKHLEACRRSGTTTAAYAARHGLDCRQLYTWRNRLTQLGALTATTPAGAVHRRPLRVVASPASRNPSVPMFSEVRLAEDAPVPRTDLRLRFANGVVVEIENPAAWTPDADFLSLLASLRPAAPEPVR